MNIRSIFVGTTLAAAFLLSVFGLPYGLRAPETVLAQAAPANVRPAAAPTVSPALPAPALPVLSELDRLRLENLAQKVTIAQMQVQRAALDFETQRTALTTMLQGLQRPGFSLNLSTLQYEPKDEGKQP